MKQIDMSPEAVTRRLRELDQIWELSVKLSKAKTVSSETKRQTGEEKSKDESNNSSKK